MVRAGALGDVLLLRRLVAALHQAGHTVTLLAPAVSGRVLLGPGPSEVDHLLDWERADVSALFEARAPLAAAMRAELTGCAVAYAFTRDGGFRRRLETMVGRVISRDPAPPPGVPAAAWLATDAPGRPPASVPHCTPTAAEEDEARALTRLLPERFLAVHPGSGSRAKNWPGFPALLAGLRPTETWLLACGPADEEAAAPLRAQPGAVVAEGLPVRGLGAVLRHAGVFVGNDSGVSHLAAAWGAPTVALFGPTDARTWSPDGDHVHVVQSPTGDMAGITVDLALAATRAARRR